jgi:iron complex outermembrane recepter protein
VALLDLLLAYDTTNWRYALNINNATDKTYFGTCLSRGDCWFGAKRNVIASATYRF